MRIQTTNKKEIRIQPISLQECRFDGRNNMSDNILIKSGIYTICYLMQYIIIWF